MGAFNILTFLTRHLHDVSRDNFSGLDPLHTLSVRTVNLAHLRLVLLESLDGTFSITLLRHADNKTEGHLSKEDNKSEFTENNTERHS